MSEFNFARAFAIGMPSALLIFGQPKSKINSQRIRHNYTFCLNTESIKEIKTVKKYLEIQRFVSLKFLNSQSVD